MKHWIIGSIAALALGGIALAWAAAPDHHDQESALNALTAVGTYQQEAAFTGYHLTEGLIQLATELEAEAMEAQQAGDHEKLRALHTRMQTRQGEVIESFLNDLERVLPDIAREERVQIIATDIQYIDPQLETKDLTEAIVSRINTNVELQEQANE